MSNMLEYRGYSTYIEYDAEDAVLYGKIEGIRSRILFDSSEAEGIEEAFHAAVDEYLLDCAEEGREPEVPYDGVVSARVGPALHRRYAEYASIHSLSLDGLVQEALRSYVLVNGDRGRPLVVA